MKRTIIAAVCIAVTLSLAGCSSSGGSEESKSQAAESVIGSTTTEVEHSPETEKPEEVGEESIDQSSSKEVDFETGMGLPSHKQLSDYYRQVAGMTLEAENDGSIVIYGYRTGEQIGEILFGDENDDYDMLLIIDKKAGDKEEGDAKYCLKNALASTLRVYNGYDIDDPFDVAWDIIEYGTQSPYTYGMEEYLVGNVNGGASYAVKISSNG